MKHKTILYHFLIILALLVGSGAATAQEQPDTPSAPLGTAFTYQGRLTDNGSPATGAYDLRFILYDAGAGGAQVGGIQLQENVPVNEGYFSVLLDFGGTAFNGQARWLEVGVRPGDSNGDFTSLSPRQQLTPAPYALYSQGAPWSGLTGLPAGFADGVDNDTTSFWGLSGSSDTTAANFLGTLDNQPLELRVNNTRMLYLGTNGSIAGGEANEAYGDASFVGSGEENSASGAYAAIPGGQGNQAYGYYSSVPGGAWNWAQGRYSLAAGCNAYALNDGSFVWGDGDCDYTQSQEPNQFVVDAAGGVDFYVDDGGLRANGARFEPGAPLNRAQPPRGNTVTTLTSTGEVGLRHSITIGADGLALIVYWDRIDYDYYTLKVAHCEDLVCSSATHSIIDSNLIGYDVYASIAIGIDGLGLISYSETNNLKVAHCSNTACTNITTSTIDNDGSYNSITIGVDGLGLVSYIKGGDLKVAHCNNTQCSSATTTILENTVDCSFGDTSITIGADGLGLIGYHNNQAQIMMVAHCEDTLCSSAVKATIYSEGNVSSSSITIGADGLGLIAFRINSTLGNLMVAHCNNPGCSDFTTASLDENAWSPSITIGADGLGLINYQKGGDLKVAHCVNTACSSSTTVALNSGGKPSITIGVDGLALISYGLDGDLKTVHCSNPFCTPYFRRR